MVVSLLERFRAEADVLVAQLASGVEVDLTALAQSLGSTVEYILCGLLADHDDTSRYWIDGVVLGTPTCLPDGSVLATGYAWCTEHDVQWQVPAQVHFSLASTPAFLALRLGDARLRDLKGHRTRRRRLTPREWLLEFHIELPS
jgi:hypothetical protein